MKKLKNKIFYTIFSILTISTLSFIIVFNFQNYLEKKNSINNSLNVSTQNGRNNVNDEEKNPPDKPLNDLEKDKKEPVNNIDENTKFMDYVVYTVLLDDEDNIKDIINHSNNNVDDSSIREIAAKILESKNIKERYIGCLYFENYSYLYIKGDSLVILDNNNIKSSLILSLEISIFIFVILEILIILISNIITNWIIKPVKESFEKQKEFIADASHELKTPLSVIMASSDALEKSPNEKKWLKNIKSESDRMNLLITNLLDLASSEKKETFNMQNANLSKIVELSVLTFEGRAFEHNVKLKYEIDDNINMNLDENSIKQLVEILLDNAVKHSNINSTINVNLKRDRNNIELLVENAGDEIPKGEEEKIFERFYRVDKSRNRKEGRYGLGLAIAKNIVLNHNGSITASSNLGVTTFKVKFKNK